MPREKVKIPTPTEYSGRCVIGEFFTFHPTYGKSAQLPEDCKYPGYEMRLPIPGTDAEAIEFYNRSIRDLVILGLGKLSTDLDGWLNKKGDVLGVKGILFQGLDNPPTMDDPALDPDVHLKAQAWLDAWRWSERAKADKRAISASAVEADMIEFGIITADEVGVYDAAQLRSKLREAMSKKKSKK